MPATLPGAVPFPPANAAPIHALANDLRALGSNLNGSSATIAATASSTTSTWVGQAGDAFRQHLIRRSATVASMGRAIASASPVLDTYGAAINSCQTAYNAAATAEFAARAAVPFSAGVLAAAIAAEAAAVGALQAAGVVCAGALVVIELEILAAELLGVSRAAFASVKEAAISIWDNVQEAVEEGDLDAAVSALNTTVEIPNGDGTSTRYNPLGMLIDAMPNVDQRLETAQDLFGLWVLATTPPLNAVDRPDLVDELVDSGYTVRPATASDHGANMTLLEMLQRRPGAEQDQAAAIFHTRGVEPDGDQVLNLTIPGIVEPGEGAWYGDSGARNLPNAAASQILSTGSEEAAIEQWVLRQDLPPGSTVNLVGHSQGGIVARNVGNRLSELGYDVNVVSYGSPDGEFAAGVDAYVVQNTRDPVPMGRIGGDDDSRVVFGENHRLIQFDHEIAGGDLRDHHDARAYGRILDDNPEQSVDTIAFHAFLADQRHVILDPSATGVVAFEGPTTPQGAPVTVPVPAADDYDVR